MSRKCIQNITLFLIIIIITGTCVGQQSGIQVTLIRNLDFQNLIPGTRKIISLTSPDAGRFAIKGNGKRMCVSVMMSADRLIFSGENSIQVNYTASVSSEEGKPGTNFNPYSGTTVTLDDKNREYYFIIGGTAYLPLSQKGGNYSSDIIIIINTIPE